MFNKKQLAITIGGHLIRAVAAVILAIVIIYIFSREISKISDKILENKRNASTLSMRSDIVAGFREDFEAIGGLDKHIEKAFPPTDNILNFISALENTAFRNGLQQSLRFNTPVLAEGEDFNPSTIDYFIYLVGDLSNFINYLKDFEKLPYLTAISNINIAGQPGSGWESASFSLTARVYTK